MRRAVVSKSMHRIVAMMISGLMLSACGYKGPLYLPPPSAAAKASSQSLPATTAPGINPDTPGMPDTSNPASPMFEQDPTMTPAPIVISN